MDFTNVLQNRRSVKHFRGQQISDEAIQNMLTAATMAPSWENNQSWKMVVVRDTDAKNKIASTIDDSNSAKKGLFEAPVMVVVCADPGRSNSSEGKDYYLVDSAIAMEHLILAAANEGLGTCWVGDLDEDKVKSILRIPGEYKVVALTPVGYPEGNNHVEGKRGIQEAAYTDQWGRVLH